MDGVEGLITHSTTLAETSAESIVTSVAIRSTAHVECRRGTGRTAEMLQCDKPPPCSSVRSANSSCGGRRNVKAGTRMDERELTTHDVAPGAQARAGTPTIAAAFTTGAAYGAHPSEHRTAARAADHLSPVRAESNRFSAGSPMARSACLPAHA